MDGLTTKEAAERLGVPVTTLKTWLSMLPIPADMDSRGRRRLDDEAIALLETVKNLRDEDCGYQTIRRRIGPETDGSPSETSQGSTSDERETDASPAPGPTIDTSVIVEAVTAAIAHQTDMAERYGKVAYELGEAKATIRALEVERERLAGELAEAKQRINLLEAPKESAAPARPWWKIWG